MYVIGVDVGGTFTDAVLMDEKDNLIYSKSASTPKDLTLGVISCVEMLAEQMGITVKGMLSKTVRLGHGTTQTTNAMIQFLGAKTGLVTTRGFRDHLILARASRGAGISEDERVYYNRVRKPKPIVPYPLTEEVVERVDCNGNVVQVLDEDDVRRALTYLVKEQGVESLAISLLWSFRNPSHEKRVKEISREMYPDVFTTVSSDLMPVIGEYERTATTVLNSYLGPILGSYCSNLQTKLEERGFGQHFLIMQSIGGLLPSVYAPENAVTTLMSGLAGGVMASILYGDILGIKDIVTSDMGGTSFEVGIVVDGSPVIATHPHAPSFGPYISRYPLLVPMVDITTIGAGGGSIAYIEEGMLKVGPLSAGAEPGPACYGQGGEKPTVTDADIVLGILNPDFFLGGRMKISSELAEKAIEEYVAEPSGMDIVESASGIKQVIDSQMGDLIRKVTIERGYDIRNFTLFAYGGAGPTHCANYGSQLGMKQILLPSHGMSSVFCGIGVAFTDLKQSLMSSKVMPAPANVAEVNTIITNMREQAMDIVEKWGVKPTKAAYTYHIDMRYKRQVHEVSIEVPARELTDKDMEASYQSFEQKYEMLFGKGSAYREAGIELVTYRLDVIAPAERELKLRKHDKGGRDPRGAIKGKREVFFAEENDFVATEIYDGDKLLSGNQIEGPAVVEFPVTTCLVLPGMIAEVDEYENLFIDLRGG